jgi:hypothetical protein
MTVLFPLVQTIVEEEILNPTRTWDFREGLYFLVFFLKQGKRLVIFIY